MPENLSTVLGKLSNLLLQESDILLGVEPHIQKVEDQLLQGFSGKIFNKGKLNELIDNIEDAITELIVTSDNRFKKHVFLQYVMAFGVQSKDLFFVMLVMQLIDQVKLDLKWSNIT
ncbi:hypothetical protein M5689_022190 [Euphorbia peplus]|nr:hypothetical protein M5689_022190 [Euphorbia peplus]